MKYFIKYFFIQFVSTLVSIYFWHVKYRKNSVFKQNWAPSVVIFRLTKHVIKDAGYTKQEAAGGDRQPMRILGSLDIMPALDKKILNS